MKGRQENRAVRQQLFPPQQQQQVGCAASAAAALERVTSLGLDQASRTELDRCATEVRLVLRDLSLADITEVERLREAAVRFSGMLLRSSIAISAPKRDKKHVAEMWQAVAEVIKDDASLQIVNICIIAD